ncbi:hypothetical protein K438DRAFT_1752765 [Mycena galopus ATCC 62051]|nr:hypothetical protein K438DRAFT_1752765 [Mycena galopus ATCC 62051]
MRQANGVIHIWPRLVVEIDCEMGFNEVMRLLQYVFMALPRAVELETAKSMREGLPGNNPRTELPFRPPTASTVFSTKPTDHGGHVEVGAYPKLSQRSAPPYAKSAATEVPTFEFAGEIPASDADRNESGEFWRVRFEFGRGTTSNREFGDDGKFAASQWLCEFRETPSGKVVARNTPTIQERVDVRVPRSLEPGGSLGLLDPGWTDVEGVACQWEYGHQARVHHRNRR